MVNSMNKSKNFITPEKAASFIPIFIASGISVLLILFFVLPQYIKSNKVNLELNGLIKKKNDLNNLKSRYKIINQKYEKLNKQKSRIIDLISGTSNLDTFLAKLGEIGKNNNIKFISIVPKKITKFVSNDSKTNTDNIQNENIVIDPLLVEGTKKYIIDFTFKTNFLNLLSFLRELEFQESVIILNNLNLNLIEENSKVDKSDEVLKVTLSMNVYGKI